MTALDHACLDCGHHWQPTPPRSIDTFTTPRASGESAADILRQQWHWPTELAATGWQQHHTDGDDTYYTRPGKDPRAGHSAVLHGTDGPLVVFTTDIGPELRQLGHLTRDGSGYAFSPLEWDAAHHHGGSLSAASRATLAANAPRTAPQAPHSHETPDKPPEDYDSILKAMLVDWADFWDTDHNEADWLAEPVIAAKRSTAIFAPGGTGKSLLALYIAASLATGTHIFGRPIEPINVLYLDYEMTADDLAERLAGMGFDEDADLTHLHYALLPSLPGLDEPEGGKAVVRLAEMVNAHLVVIDTFGRAVHGDENEADTVRKWYRWTGIHLKHAGRAFLRVDHAGKDVTKGQRGTSAKNDDVDVVWQMAAKDGGAYTLTAKKRRMGWVPLTVDLVMHEDNRMRFELLKGHTWRAGTADMAAVLDDLGLPAVTTKRAAREALKAAGRKASDPVLLDAIKYRKERSVTFHFTGDRPVDNPPHHDSHHAPTESAAPRNAPPNTKTAKPQVNTPTHQETHHSHHTPDAYPHHGGERSEPHGRSVTGDDDFNPETDLF